MAKAILEYDVANPDDRALFLKASRADDLALALWELDQYLHRRLKGEELEEPAIDFDSLASDGVEGMDAEAAQETPEEKALTQLRDRLHLILSEHELYALVMDG
jgi:hypothetical protein